MKPETTKRWFIFCEPCSHKQIINAEDLSESGLNEIKTVTTPGGAPFIDPTTKKMKIKPNLPRPRKFKCPKCGRGVTASKLPEVYEKAYKFIDEEKRKREAEIEKKKRIEDGKPPIREKKDEEFIG